MKSAKPSYKVAKLARVAVGASQNARSLPISFEQNVGQSSKEVRFLSRGPGFTLFLTHNAAVLSLRPTVKQESGNAVLKMKVLGANPNPSASGLSELPGKSNYFVGNDPRQWHKNIVNYAKVRYQDVYPGVDLVYYGNKNQLEYDFLLAPSAQPKDIQLSFEGADRIEVDPRSGDLVLAVGKQEVRLPKPGVYQTDGTADSRADSQSQSERKHFIEARYVIGKHNRVSFEVAPYDSTKALVIDPTLTYSTYLGGSSNDYGDSIAVDASGNAYVVGYTSSTKFPTTTGAYQTQCSGGCSGSNTDAFITKFDPTGGTLIYSTYLGGSGKEVGNGIVVDAAGNAYVVGQTYSTNFPVTAGAFQKSCSNNCLRPDAFVTELDSSGSGLAYSTYLGGKGSDQANAIALDASGNAYITGYTQSTNFPVTPGAFQSTCNCSAKPDTYVAALNPTGSALVYSTYVGGSNIDVGYGIALDSSNNAYITGYTESTDFPTTTGAFQATLGALQGGFVTKVNSTGTALVYSTYLGGSTTNTTPCETCSTTIAVNSAGNAYVCGLTAEANFPITPGAYQSKFRSSSNGHDAFITEFNTEGTALIFSTYLGGSGDDGAVGLAVDSAGNVWLKGNTKSTNFPITTGAFQARNGGSFDAFVSELNSSGTSLLYSTYLGGKGTEFGGATQALALDSANPYNVYVVGYTNSTNYPITIGAFQTRNAGTNDAFVAKFSSAASAKAGSRR